MKHLAKAWSADGAVRLLLPVNVKDRVTADEAAWFVDADTRVQFDVMVVLRYRSRGVGTLLSSLSVILATIGLVIAAYNVASTRDLLATLVLVAFLVLCMGGLFALQITHSRINVAAEWLDAYTYAAQQTTSKA